MLHHLIQVVEFRRTVEFRYRNQMIFKYSVQEDGVLVHNVKP